MPDVSDELATNIAKGATGIGLFEQIDQLLQMLGRGSLGASGAPKLSDKLPRKDFQTNEIIDPSGARNPLPVSKPRAKQSSASPAMRTVQADRELRAGGSVFGKPQEPEFVRNNPILGAINDLLAGIGSPLEGVGGPMNAAIPGFAKLQPEAKALLNVLADKFPETFKRVLGSADELRVSTNAPFLPGELGSLIRSPAQNVAGTEIPARAIANIVPSQASRTEVPVHEIFGHFLQGPRVAKTNPADAESIANLLGSIDPSLVRSTASLRKAQLNPSLRPKLSTELPIVQQAFMDEMFANITELSSIGQLKPEVQKLAELLGLAPK